MATTTHRLWLSDDWDLWLVEDAEEECRHSMRLLGEPREGLYSDVPPGLWPDLERMIADYREAVKEGREYRAQVEGDYDGSRFR